VSKNETIPVNIRKLTSIHLLLVAGRRWGVFPEAREKTASDHTGAIRAFCDLKQRFVELGEKRVMQPPERASSMYLRFDQHRRFCGISGKFCDF